MIGEGKMLLMASHVVKFFIVIAMFLLLYKNIAKKGVLKKNLFILLGLMVLIIAISLYCLKFVPVMTDIVTIEAQGEFGSQGGGVEIFVDGYDVDGVFYTVENAVDGTWFWNGTHYGWRSENDKRRPDDLTREIKVSVPVGWERKVIFSSNQWRGWATVSTLNSTQKVDTSVISEVVLEKSETSMLIQNQIRYLICFAFCIISCTFIEILASKKIHLLKQFIKKYKWNLVYALIALFQLSIAVYHAGIDCFWYDELYEIGWSIESENILQRAFAGAVPLPIYGFIMGIWYQIAPYGEKWLLLLSEIGTAIGIYMIAIASRECKGEIAGLFSAMFTAVSCNILYQCSYEIRSYGLYFAAAAILLYLYLKRLSVMYNEQWKIIIGLSIAMTFFAGMHYHALVQCGAFFVFDVILLLNKRIGWRCFVPYIVVAISYVPSTIKVLRSSFISNLVTDSWHPVPGITEINLLIEYLSGNSVIIEILFCIGVSCVVVLAGQSIYSKPIEGKSIKSFIIITPLYILCFVILFFVIYGNCINPQASLWYNRYFVDLIPSFAVLGGIGVFWLYELLYKIDRLYGFSFLLVVCLFVVPTSVDELFIVANNVRQPYGAAADWIYSQGNYIHNDETVVLSNDPAPVVAGWNEYYIQKQGERQPINVISQYNIEPDELQTYERVYYIHLQGSWLRSELRDVLNQKFSQVDQNEYFVIYQRN